MCTAFVKKGKDTIVGFNFDMNVGGMDYCPIIEADRIGLGMRLPSEALKNMPKGIDVGDGIRMIQGVEAGGYVGGLLCNMDFSKRPEVPFPGILTIDQLENDFLNQKYSYESLKEILDHHAVMNLPDYVEQLTGTKPLALHGMFVGPEGKIVFVEPGNGYAVINEDYFTVTNFSILECPLDLDNEKFGYYGVDRYRKSLSVLKESSQDFSVEDGLNLLDAVKQTGNWGTRFSFVYSFNENAAYYCLEGEFDKVTRHPF